MIERSELFPHPRYPIADIINDESRHIVRPLDYTESLRIADLIVERLAEEYGVTRTYNQRFTLMPTPERKETRP